MFKWLLPPSNSSDIKRFLGHKYIGKEKCHVWGSLCRTCLGTWDPDAFFMLKWVRLKIIYWKQPDQYLRGLRALISILFFIPFIYLFYQLELTNDHTLKCFFTYVLGSSPFFIPGWNKNYFFPWLIRLKGIYPSACLALATKMGWINKNMKKIGGWGHN